MANDNDIAIVGMACRLPGSRNPRELWRNLKEGVESVKQYTEAELLEAGVKKETLRRKEYVRSGAPLDKMEYFDGEFFGFSPKESAILDPQHRQFLECTWEALEDAGHMPETFDGAIGVFAGCGMGSYFMFNLLTNPELVRNVGLFLLRHTGNDKDFLATRVSYLLDLRGPSINVQTACSTSLVAVHLAAQHLLSGECDMAIAGGVTIEIPHRRGYHYAEGEILSPDGHCRAFDHRSAGTIFGSGAGVVVLRRLKDALADGDVVHAVIRATAVNNDGSQKVGYLAPSVDGQAACIAEAMAVADVEPDTLSYIECHGTGTAMGDPIEVAALTQAFRESTDKKQFCGIGSIKTNIGHLDTAAGVASLIKATLSLEHKAMAPTLNWEKPNPQIDFESSPFFVNHKLREWKAGATPRRAGINSLGVGGTNAFAILEEAPERATAAPSKRPAQLIALSARNKGALDDGAKALAQHLREHPELNLADVAWTLQVGRRAFSERRVLAAQTREEAIELLEKNDPKRVFTHSAADKAADKQSVAFLFPGGGAQYPRMAKDLYDKEPVFKRHMDDGLAKLRAKHGVDLMPLLFCAPEDKASAGAALEKPGVQLPAIFLVEYSLAQLYLSWGVKPTALLGHSMGENTAACIAGTMSFDDCLGLVALRGKLMDGVTPGGMLSVPMPKEELVPLLDELGLDLATVNAPELCVASGTNEGLAALEVKLKERGVEAQRVKIHIAAHSRLLDGILDEFSRYLRSIKLSAPKIPWVSNRTGTWITTEQATSPAYWVEHLRNTVLFAEGVKVLAEDPGRVFLEVGPGKTLSSLAKMHAAVRPSQACIASLRHPDDTIDDASLFLATLGRLWAAGGALPTQKLFEGEKRRRVSLPAYAFQSQRYFIEPGKGKREEESEGADILEKEQDLERWFYEPRWKRRDADDGELKKQSWLVFVDGAGVGRRLVERLQARGDDVITVTVGDSYRKKSDREFVLAPEHGRTGYDNLARDLVQQGTVPDRVVHLWLLAAEEEFRPGSSFFHRNQERGFYSLLFFAQAWSVEAPKKDTHFVVATSGMQQVPREGGADVVRYPEQATVLGPALVLPRELPGATVAVVDIDVREVMRERTALERVGDLVHALEESPLAGAVDALRARAPSLLDKTQGAAPIEAVVEALKSEVLAPAHNVVAAHRGGKRYVQELRRAELRAEGAPPGAKAALSGAKGAVLREGGVLLVTGGLGGIGMSLAEHLAKTRKAKLALLARTALPERSQWKSVVSKLGPDHPTSRRIARIEALERSGAEVLVLAGDVTDVERMKEVVADVRSRFGGLHGVIHAAGVVDDALLSQKSQADVEQVLAPKVYGTLVLDQVTRDEDLDLFVVFSSTSTAIAPAGQVDYVAANAFLNAFAHARSASGKGKTLSLNWGVWNEVGMAADAASRMMGADAPGGEPAHHPWLDRKQTDERGVVSIFARWSPETHWMLDEHRTREGEALLPGAGYLELCRAALAEIGLNRPFEIRDLTFFRPFAVEDGAAREARIKLVPNEQGYAFELAERVTLEGATAEGASTPGRTGWRKTAQASLWLHEQSAPAPVDVRAVEARAVGKMPTRSKQEDHLRFGPRWRVVTHAQRTGAHEAVARLELAEAFAQDVRDVALHPGLVDLGTGFAMDLIEGYSGSTLWVPVSYRGARIFGALPRNLVSVVRARPGSSEAQGFAHFDVSLCDEMGRVLVEVEELTIKRLEGKLELQKNKRIAPTDVELDAEKRSESQLSPAELAFRHNLAQGILPAEGTRAFDRAAASFDGPQVYVSSLDLNALVQQSGRVQQTASAEAAETGTKFSRPQLASDYLEPRDDIERTLVSIWEELLGVSGVGVQDSFFDLGGHSLIAVRLFAKVKKSFGVEFPISVLFEAPTIEGCAALIRRALPQSDGGPRDVTDVERAPEQAKRPRYKHLVAMHPGEGGPRAPFFLVAGMFGNVLNLRHLAHQLGTDRPFYGVQARGLYGGEEPHETFEEMAKDYLAEVRLVQPKGPYYLGGFSGGGLAALEMARQLIEAGEEIALLVMLDTPLPTSEQLTRADKVKIHLQNVQRKGAAYAADIVKNRVNWELRKWRDRNYNAAQEHDGELHSKAIELAFYRALGRYTVQRHPGVISLFRPKLVPMHVFGPGRMINKDRRFIYEDNGWAPYCERVDVVEVPGDHDSMVLEPNVRVLASRLREQMLAAEKRARGATIVPMPDRHAAE